MNKYLNYRSKLGEMMQKCLFGVEGTKLEQNGKCLLKIVVLKSCELLFVDNFHWNCSIMFWWFLEQSQSPHSPLQCWYCCWRKTRHWWRWRRSCQPHGILLSRLFYIPPTLPRKECRLRSPSVYYLQSKQTSSNQAGDKFACRCNSLQCFWDHWLRQSSDIFIYKLFKKRIVE